MTNISIDGTNHITNVVLDSNSCVISDSISKNKILSMIAKVKSVVKQQFKDSGYSAEFLDFLFVLSGDEETLTGDIGRLNSNSKMFFTRLYEPRSINAAFNVSNISINLGYLSGFSLSLNLSSVESELQQIYNEVQKAITPSMYDRDNINLGPHTLSLLSNYSQSDDSKTPKQLLETNDPPYGVYMPEFGLQAFKKVTVAVTNVAAQAVNTAVHSKKENQGHALAKETEDEYGDGGIGWWDAGGVEDFPQDISTDISTEKQDEDTVAAANAKAKADEAAAKEAEKKHNEAVEEKKHNEAVEEKKHNEAINADQPPPSEFYGE